MDREKPCSASALHAGTRKIVHALATWSCLASPALAVEGPSNPSDLLTPDQPDRTTTPSERLEALKSLSLADLLDVDIQEVTSVSRKPEQLGDVASSVQVISSDDIRRSGATVLPQALEQATNLEVAQVDTHNWAISARGFDNTLANKLLVQIDGRNVYTPIDAGVFWNSQQVFLPDVDRIEVISGPGATQWGSNAVNGVISINSKDSSQTQGLLVEGLTGTAMEGQEGVRYGGRIDGSWSYRVYEFAYQKDDSDSAYGPVADNRMDVEQGGFRSDYAHDSSHVTIQGDVLHEQYGQEPLPGQGPTDPINTADENILARWTQNLSPTASSQVQAYFDQTHQVQPGVIGLNQQSWDLDVQERFSPLEHHDVVYGGDARLYRIDTFSSNAGGFLPPQASMHIASVFAQDEVIILPKTVHFTAGTKLERDTFSGWALEPSARLAVTPAEHHLIWAAVSRAVRSPSLAERDFYAPVNSPHLLAGGPGFSSEHLIAYEAGYRVEPIEHTIGSVSTYYNHYTQLTSTAEQQPPNPLPLVEANGLDGDSYGCEAMIDSRVLEWVRVRVGYTELRVHLHSRPGYVNTPQSASGATTAIDPEHQLRWRTSVDITPHWEADANLRSVSSLKAIGVPAYVDGDARLAYLPVKDLTFALVGQNLLHDYHEEFGTAPQNQISRSVYFQVVWSP